jgi:phage baseplate assembly protein W
MAKYTDIDFSLSKNEITDDINVKTDINAISQSIKNIILTSKTEKIFDNSFGADGYDLVYNNLSKTEILAQRSKFLAELQVQEPRAIIRDINIEDNKSGSFIITVTFSPVYDTSITRNLNLEFTVDRGQE